MFEGILSLMQMAKTNALLARLSDAGIPYISILTHPTTGGVTASFASVGDVILAEPKALIGFAGPRVIKQTIHQELPEGFQRSEFLLQKGMVDQIVPRPEMRKTLAWLLRFFAAAERLPHPPRRRAGESLERFHAASEPVPSPVGHALSATPAPAPAVPAPAPVPAPDAAPAKAKSPDTPAASPAGATRTDE